MDRALPSGGRSRRFDSCREYSIINTLKITSRDNQRLKNAKNARDGKIAGALFVEGLRLAEECLKSGLKINEVFYVETFTENPRGAALVKKLSEIGCELFEVPAALLKTISDTKNPQGLILVAEKPSNGKPRLESAAQIPFPLVVLLHEVNNPNNLGAIVRTAEAAGVSGLILTKGSANPFSPKALRASMGSAFRVPVWEDADFDAAIAWGTKLGFLSICADVSSNADYRSIDWKKPRLIVFGSEAHGLSDDEKEKIAESTKIPMKNGVESLNLAVSAGILLFEAGRVRN